MIEIGPMTQREVVAGLGGGEIGGNGMDVFVCGQNTWVSLSVISMSNCLHLRRFRFRNQLYVQPLFGRGHKSTPLGAMVPTPGVRISDEYDRLVTCNSTLLRARVYEHMCV